MTRRLTQFQTWTGKLLALSMDDFLSVFVFGDTIEDDQVPMLLIKETAAGFLATNLVSPTYSR